MQGFSKGVLRIFGWKVAMAVPHEKKSVICVAPHTSNWDFAFGKLGCWALGITSSFFMKKEWFFFPLGAIFKAMGGVPVDRSKRKSLTDQMADEFASRDSFHLAITPEGTRKLAKEWKMGFYYIALKAGVPIQLAYIDAAKREIGIGKTVHLTGDVEKDMAEVYDFYRTVTPLKADKFYVP